MGDKRELDDSVMFYFANAFNVSVGLILQIDWEIVYFVCM